LKVMAVVVTLNESDIDDDGFRPNIGIVITNTKGQVFWAKRIGQDAWQFPQGGIHKGEKPEEAFYRELFEEVGLDKGDVRLLRRTKGWLHYRLPKRFWRKQQVPLCIGQKQIWFLVELISDESAVNLSRTASPEFDHWEWVSFWYPVNKVIHFKRKVYQLALRELVLALPDY